MYQKVTLESFKKSLKAGKYENATAAKRALGRVQLMSSADKDAARAAANKHFGVQAPKKTSKLAPKPAARAAAKTVRASSKAKKANKAAAKPVKAASAES